MTERGDSTVDVLVVDDDNESRSVCADILKTVGFTVETAMNGLDGLALARRDHPKLIFADLVMGPMDGVELITQLRQDPDLAEVPVVLLSGSDDLDQVSVELGVAAHLAKPFDIDTLIETTQRLAHREP